MALRDGFGGYKVRTWSLFVCLKRELATAHSLTRCDSPFNGKQWPAAQQQQQQQPQQEEV